MKTAHFYLLETDTPKGYSATVCQLVDQLWREKVTLYLYCPDIDTARQFDHDLWTFRDLAFIPHRLATDASSPPNPLPTCLIGYPGIPAHPVCDILFHLADEVLESFTHYPKVVEVVTTSETKREKSRERYRAYQREGYKMKTNTS